MDRKDFTKACRDYAAKHSSKNLTRLLRMLGFEHEREVPEEQFSLMAMYFSDGWCKTLASMEAQWRSDKLDTDAIYARWNRHAA